MADIADDLAGRRRRRRGRQDAGWRSLVAIGVMASQLAVAVAVAARSAAILCGA